MNLREKLILDICNCPNIQSAKNNSSHPCHQVVSTQSGVGNQFQLPEPWNGDLEKVRLLFVSSNPSIDESEAYPTVEWKDELILDFFQNRFHPNSKWTEDARRVLSKDGETYVKRYVPFWAETRSMATDAFGTTARPGLDYALTEIVHCKSRKRQGVKSAAKTCFDLWMNPIISNSDARVIIVLGDEAKEMMSQFLNLDSGVKFHRRVILGDTERIVLFLPAPGSSKPRKITRVFSQSERKEIEDALNF